MSGALYFYFWPDWVGAPPAPPPPPPPPAPPPAPNPQLPGTTDSGGGGNKGRGRGKGKLDYEPLPPDYWDAREIYLRTLFPEEIEPAPPPDLDMVSEANRAFEARKQQLEQLNSERAVAIHALRESPDIQTMKQQGARILEINHKIADLMGKQAYARFARH